MRLYVSAHVYIQQGMNHNARRVTFPPSFIKNVTNYKLTIYNVPRNGSFHGPWFAFTHRVPSIVWGRLFVFSGVAWVDRDLRWIVCYIRMLIFWNTQIESFGVTCYERWQSVVMNYLFVFSWWIANLIYWCILEPLIIVVWYFKDITHISTYIQRNLTKTKVWRKIKKTAKST